MIYKQATKAEREESSSFIFYSYFVECDTNQLRKLKRVQYLSVLNNFITNVSSLFDEKYEVRSPSPFGRRVEVLEDSTLILDKTATSLFFVSRLNPEDKATQLNNDYEIPE